MQFKLFGYIIQIQNQKSIHNTQNSTSALDESVKHDTDPRRVFIKITMQTLTQLWLEQSDCRFLQMLESIIGCREMECWWRVTDRTLSKSVNHYMQRRNNGRQSK